MWILMIIIAIAIALSLCAGKLRTSGSDTSRKSAHFFHDTEEELLYYDEEYDTDKNDHCPNCDEEEDGIDEDT